MPRTPSSAEQQVHSCIATTAVTVFRSKLNTAVWSLLATTSIGQLQRLIVSGCAPAHLQTSLELSTPVPQTWVQLARAIPATQHLRDCRDNRSTNSGLVALTFRATTSLHGLVRHGYERSLTCLCDGSVTDECAESECHNDSCGFNDQQIQSD